MSPYPDAAVVGERVAGWFARQARALPWRRDPTPYHVLLSELMLQQTRVETVIPYYERFLARWPTLDALARAAEHEVLQEWAGLGYYSRARNLHRCAIAAVAAGGLPSDPQELRRLPGIGPYTAGAVASIAFGIRAPLVDGNVERVLSRIDARHEDPRRAGRAPLWERAAALLEASPQVPPGALNQALMELGAVVCTPRSPRCTSCPVEDLCLGRKDDPQNLPRRAPKPRPTEMHGVAVIARCAGGWVVGRRPPGLLGGLWEPIRVEVGPGQSVVARIRDGFREETGAELTDLRHLGELVHVFTHRRLTCAVYEGLTDRGLGFAESLASSTPRRPPHAVYEEIRVVDDPGVLGLSSLARKVLALGIANADRPCLPFAAEPPERSLEGQSVAETRIGGVHADRRRGDHRG
jgi:A/G-specific adenine glycosylase